MKIFVLLATNPLDFFYKQPYVSLGYVRLVRSRRKTISLLDLLATNPSDFFYKQQPYLVVYALVRSVMIKLYFFL